MKGKAINLPLIFSSNSIVDQINGSRLSDGLLFADQFPGLVLLPKQITNAVITGTPSAATIKQGARITLINLDANNDLSVGNKLEIQIIEDTDNSIPSITGLVEFDFVVGVPVSRQLTADNSGNLFEKEEGDIPPGLSLTPGGLLSGIPTTAGTFGPRIKARNGATNGFGQLFRMVVTESPPSITSSSVLS